MQVLVIGAGVIGLAVARAAARRGHEVVVAEAANAIGTGISSRNSEVIHGGMYYPTGSLRARHCVAGRRLLYEFCASHGVPHRKCGKLIVATNDAELAKIEAIAAQGRINDVEGLEMIGGNAARALEPELVLHRRAAFAGDRHHRRPRLHAGAARRSRGCRRRHRLQHAGDGRRAQRRPLAGRVRRPRWRQLRIRRDRQLRRLARASRGANDAGLSGHARAEAGAGQGQLFFLRRQAGVLAADLSDADRRRASACMSRSISPAACASGRMSNGSSAKITPSIRRAPTRSTRASAPIGRACPTARLSPDYSGIRPKLTGQGEPAGGFPDRRAGAARAAGTGADVRDRVAGADQLAVAGGGGCRLSRKLSAAARRRLRARPACGEVRRLRRGRRVRPGSSCADSLSRSLLREARDRTRPA